MSQIRNHRDLEAWRTAIDILLAVYQLCAELPRHEQFILSAQMRRAALSVPSNVAEGQARRSPRAFIHFIGIALGSLAELDTQLEIVVRLNYCSGERTRHIEDLLGTERKMLFGLRRALGRQLLVFTGVPAMLLLIGLRVW